MTERGWLAVTLLVIAVCALLGSLPFIAYEVTAP